MGASFSVSTLSAGSAGIDVPELADIAHEKSLGDARFMKAIRARHQDGLVVAKVVMKPFASVKFGEEAKQIKRERKILFDIPNTLGYHRLIETSSAGYLVRQYIYSSIYDRMSTRPFLEDIEKRWLAFQLLSAVRDCHARSLYHGDIKTENTLVTSWNWLYLTDFSGSYKPVYLPEDNPALFSFFFDISGRRTCYLAPERFLAAGETANAEGTLTWAMDIFSVGCVIAEIFLETPIFNLAQLFRYRKGEYDPEILHLNRIEDEDVRELVSHMIQLEPESRYSADEYLNFWRRKSFPEYFYSFLHQYMNLITDPTSGRARVRPETGNNGESDDRIDRVYNDFDKIAYFLEHNSDAGDQPTTTRKPLEGHQRMFSPGLDVSNIGDPASRRVVERDDGTLLFVNIVTSAMRSTARAASKIRACELLLVFSERITDEAKLDRVLPFIMSLVSDQSDMVKAAGLRTLTQLLTMVSVTSPVNAYLFPEYILPRLETSSPVANRKMSSNVRATYAACFATLVNSASRFLDIVQILKAEGAITINDPQAEKGALSLAYQDFHDVARADLVKYFETQTKALLTDSSAEVRRAFLGSVSLLCAFFGSAKANDVILSHMNTYLNDKDWRLKSSFFETIVGVAVYVGGANLEEFILPLMLQALTDPEETVVEKVLRSLATMAQLGLFQRTRIWELIDVVARFSVHPNPWIRDSAISFISGATRYLTVADCECIVTPMLAPFLRIPPKSFSMLDLVYAMKPPFSRKLLDMANLWVVNAQKGIFWKPVKTRTNAQSTYEPNPVDLGVDSLAKVQKNEEDQKWIGRLRSQGMTTDDEFKLIALREHIWRSQTRRQTVGTESLEQDPYKGITKISSLGVTPETVFFDHQEQYLNEALGQEYSEKSNRNPSQTIADALLDASMSIDEQSRSPTPSGAGSTTPAMAIPDRSKSRAADHSPQVASSLSTSHQSHTTIVDNDPKGSVAPPRLSSSSRKTSSGTLEGFRHEHLLRPKSSAIDLMGRKFTASKASPEIGTSSAHAAGKIDGQFVTKPNQTTSFNLLQERQTLHPSTRQFQSAHNYRGNDPNVLKLLDTVYLDSFPMDGVEFGPKVLSVKAKHAEKQQDHTSDEPWRPKSTLVAVLGDEHMGPVKRIIVPADHLFFLTASADGTVRVWDSARLEQNLSHRPRQIYKQGKNARITSICFVKYTHCFVSCASDGSVHVVKVDCSETSSTLKYGKLKPLREWQLPIQKSYIVWCDHFRSDSKSILLLATITSQVIAIDLRSMSVLYTLENPVEHGNPTCFCVASNGHWIVLGTMSGCLDLWDLRFQVRIKSWIMPGSSPINRIFLHPSPPDIPADNEMDMGVKSPRKLICVVGGMRRSEITVWDIQTETCAGVYRDSSLTSPADQPQLQNKSYTLTNLDALSPDGKSKRLFSASKAQTETPEDPDPCSLVVGNLVPANDAAPVPFFVTAGLDGNVRFWDLSHVSSSCIISGPNVPNPGNDQFFKYKRLDTGGPTPVYAELPAGDGKNATRPRREREERRGANTGIKRSTSGALAVSEAGSEVSEAVSSSSGRKRDPIVSEKEQRRLRSHVGLLTDVAVLQYPTRMVVSADHNGTVMVFS